MEMSTGLAKSLNLFASGENSQDLEIQTQFRNRVKTYIEGQKWVHKPHLISPAICARYGWKCISSQLLECDTCSAKIIPGQLKIESFQTYKACVQKIQENLKTSHKELCPWPITPCPESFIRMLPVHKEVALKEFKNRFESLLVLDKQLPLIKGDVPEKLGFTEESTLSLLKLLDVEKCDRNLSAVFLASTGWTNIISEKPRSLSCLQCQRNVALILYSSVSNNSSQSVASQGSTNSEKTPEDELHAKENEVPNGSAADAPGETDKTECRNDAAEPGQKRKSLSDADGYESSPSKQIKRVKLSEKPLSCFDPMFEHRPWCLWVVESSARERKSTASNSASEENGYFALPGWQLFTKCLLRNIQCSDASSSPLKEQISSARCLVESWSSPA